MWLLQDLNNLDKHNVIAVTALVAEFTKLTPEFDPSEITIIGMVEKARRGPLNHRAPIAVYNIREHRPYWVTGPDPKMDVKVEGAFDVVLGKGTPAPNEELFKVLGDIRGRVEAILWMMGGRFVTNAP